MIPKLGGYFIVKEPNKVKLPISFQKHFKTPNFIPQNGMWGNLDNFYLNPGDYFQIKLGYFGNTAKSYEDWHAQAKFWCYVRKSKIHNTPYRNNKIIKPLVAQIKKAIFDQYLLTANLAEPYPFFKIYWPRTLLISEQDDCTYTDNLSEAETISQQYKGIKSILIPESNNMFSKFTQFQE